MPQVAFETKNIAPNRPPAPAPRQAASEHANAPFESLLEPARDAPKSDDSARSNRAEQARSADKPADKSANKPIDKPAETSTDKADADTSMETAAETGAKDAATTDDDTSTGEGEDAAAAPPTAADAKAAAATGTVATDAATSAEPAIVTGTAAPTIVGADAIATAAAASPEDGQAPALATVQASAVATTLQVKTLTPAKPDGEPSTETAVSADAARTSATTALPHAGAKPHLTEAEAALAKAQMPADAQAKPQHAAPPVVDTTAASNGVAPPPSAEAPLPSPLTAPTNTAPPTAAAAAAPTAPAAPQSAAIPLAGVPIEIAGKALEGKNRFEIRLDPADLGRIDVRLDVDRDGKVTARMVVERPDTLDLLRRDAPNLERALQDAGLKTSGNGLQFSLRDQSTDHHHNGGHSDRAHMIATDEATSVADIIPADYRRPLARAGGLDIQV